MDFCSLGFLSNKIVSKSRDCGSMASRGHDNELNLYLQKQWWSTALYYICNRQEFQNISWCYINEIREICGSCEKCSECLFSFRDDIHFYLETLAVEESW